MLRIFTKTAVYIYYDGYIYHNGYIYYNGFSVYKRPVLKKIYFQYIDLLRGNEICDEPHHRTEDGVKPYHAEGRVEGRKKGISDEERFEGTVKTISVEGRAEERYAGKGILI